MIAKALIVVGWLAILGGVILGFQNYEVVAGVEENILGGLDEVTDKSFGRFFMYAIAGTISGLMMFGFAEILNLLDKGNATKQRIENHLKHESKMRKSNETEIDKAVAERKEQRLSNTNHNNKLKSDMRLAEEIAAKKKNNSNE